MASYNFQNGHEEVVQQLNELFGNSLNLNLIKSVAKSCKFDVEQSSLQLLEMTSQPNITPAMSNLRINPVAIRSEPKKSKKISEIESAIAKINAGYKVLILLRGLPGSGKSTLAKIILEHTIGYNNETAQQHILSTDDFFMKNGVYQHDARQLPEAHGWNHQRAFNVMCKGYSPVIIDNTNTQMWEMKPYALMATDYGYFLEILEPDTHWCFNEKELTKRNNHDVPRATIKNMNERYHKNITPMKLLTAYDCKYKLQKPPQFRLHPPISCEPARPVNFSFRIPKPVSFPKKKSPAKPSPLKLYTVDNQTNQVVEAINLMDFSEPDVPFVPFKPTKKQTQAASLNDGSVSVDNLLMYDDGTALKSTILSPTAPTKMKQSTSLFDDMKNAWGIDETSLRSWDIVTPLKENTSKNVEIVEIDDDPVVETKEISTSTDDEDFYILRNVCFTPLKDIKVLTTCNRDINRYAAVQPRVVPKKLMLDKSCLTEDYFDDQNLHIEHLTHVFPNVPVKTLKYWYNKCNRDFECTIELLLNERDEVISVVVDDEETESVIAPDKPEQVVLVDTDSLSSSDNEAVDCEPKPHKQKRKNNSSSSDESQQLKKCIESKVTISSDHYSDKLLKVRQQKFGEPASSNAPQPGTSSASKPNSPTNEVPVGMDFEFIPEFDDIEWEETSSPEQNQNDNLETVELNLGENFVKQLEDRFGDPNLLYPKGFQPVVQVPVALARQMYTFYIESVYQQMDAQRSVLEALMKEDEEFARNLQEKEEEAAKFAIQRSRSQEECTQLPDIIKEQKELSKWQKEVDKWKELTPDTLAAKLTRDKLFNVFPSLDRDTLVEILQAHDNVYKDTVETLLASTNFDDVRGHMDSIKDPPINQTVITEMWKDHESCKETKEGEALRTAESYREEANRFLKKRSDLYEKAQRYNQAGMKEVAQFYSSLAAQQTKLYEKANSFAATVLLDGHSKRLQDFNTLDLHFLYVKEAIPSLDVFLDRNINLLRLSSSKNTEYLQIITGRGKNSQNGVAKIRPAVISRLKHRKITYQQLNPGLLKIRLTKNSLVTSEL